MLEEEAKAPVVINMHNSLYKYNLLPFRVASAPGIFQRVMEGLLAGIQGVVVYIDDILITGKSTSEHLSSLKAVLTRLENAGLRLKRQKFPNAVVWPSNAVVWPSNAVVWPH